MIEVGKDLEWSNVFVPGGQAESGITQKLLTGVEPLSPLLTLGRRERSR